jgi:hypothetical protein
MEMFMIYKISPHPSLPKRGKERGNFSKEGKKRQKCPTRLREEPYYIQI